MKVNDSNKVYLYLYLYLFYKLLSCAKYLWWCVKQSFQYPRTLIARGPLIAHSLKALFIISAGLTVSFYCKQSISQKFASMQSW
jgi:hypothetical protein